MEVSEVGQDLDLIVLLFSAADIIEPGKFEENVARHKWIIEIALQVTPNLPPLVERCLGTGEMSGEEG